MACKVDCRCVDNCVGVATYYLFAHYYLHTYRVEMLAHRGSCLVKLASPEPGGDRARNSVGVVKVK